MQIFRSSKEYIKEMPIVRKLTDVLDDDDIFILAVSDETYEEYKTFEETIKNEREDSIFVPNFYKIETDIPREEYERPDHYIVYSERNKNNIEEEIEIEEKFLNLVSKNIEEVEVKKIIIFLEDNYEFDTIDSKIKHNVLLNFPHIRESVINLIYSYWTQKTNEKKKSMFRKYWRKHKLTDKFVLGTFNRRKNSKVRTRNSNKQLITLISKLKEKKTELEENLLKLMNGIILRESLKKTYLNLEIFDFYGLKSCYYNKSIINSLQFFQRLSRKKRKFHIRKNKIKIRNNVKDNCINCENNQ